jgi:Domain of unknown function (DUF4365)
MPRRPQSHVIADRATAAVGRLITDAGFAVEVVQNDYGEDLLVQTAHAGQMDATRLWFQIKGTEDIQRYTRKDKAIRLSFPFDQVLRWLRSADPVAVVLWDVANDQGYLAWPMSQVEAWQSLFANDKRAILTFSGPLDVDRVSDIAWIGRFYHYWRLLKMAEARDEEVQANIGPVPDMGRQQVHIIADFLGLLQVVERSDDARTPGWRITPTARARFGNVLGHILDNPDARDTAEQAFVEDTSEDSLGSLVLAANVIVIEDFQLRATGFQLVPPESTIPMSLLDAGAKFLRVMEFPGGLDEVAELLNRDESTPAVETGPSITVDGKRRMGFGQIVELLRAGGVDGDVFIVGAKDPKLILLIEHDLPQNKELYLSAALNELLGIDVALVTDAEPWRDAELIPITASGADTSAYGQADAAGSQDPQHSDPAQSQTD